MTDFKDEAEMRAMLTGLGLSQEKIDLAVEAWRRRPHPSLKSPHPMKGKKHPRKIPAASSSDMAIRRLLEHSAFEPEEIKHLIEGYELALDHLSLKKRSDGLNELIAHHILEAARSGEKSPARLCQIAIERVGGPACLCGPSEDKSSAAR